MFWIKSEGLVQSYAIRLNPIGIQEWEIFNSPDSWISLEIHRNPTVGSVIFLRPGIRSECIGWSEPIISDVGFEDLGEETQYYGHRQ